MRFPVFFLLLSLLFVRCTKDENKPPVANAGPSKTHTSGALSLTGSGSDEDGQIVAYVWSQVSGPTSTTIINPGSPNTSVSGFAAGNYVFQLLVTDDDGATGADTMSVQATGPTSQTITLQPSNNPNEKMLIQRGSTDLSSQGGNEWIIDAWTSSGQLWIGRNVFKFDLSTIPSTATILSANLFLYSNTPPENGNLVDANFGAGNSLLLQRISTNWSPASANWSNQPSVVTADQLILPASTASVQDLNIDVKNHVATMVNTSSNYGWMIRLENETPLKSRAFVSSYHAAKPALRPKLIITYQP